MHPPREHGNENPQSNLTEKKLREECRLTPSANAYTLERIHRLVFI
jgi:hypothetical protein